MTRAIGIAVLSTILMAFAASSPAAVFNIHLYSDSNPDITTRHSFLETALPVWSTPEEQAVAMWRWGVRHRRQVTPTREDGRSILDPILFLNNYAGTNCGYITGMLQGWVEGLGQPWQARYVQLSDHTVMEMSWDDGASWHMFDASMVVYCRNNEGEVASVAEIAESHVSELSLLLGETGPVPGHHYLYNFSPECGSSPVNPAHAGDLGYPWGYRCAADNPVSYSRTLRNGADSYLSGGRPETAFTRVRNGWNYRLNLKQHESYTRHWTHLGETEDYFRPNAAGNDPDLGDLAGDMRGNGRWLFSPDLFSPDYRWVIHDETGVVHRIEAGSTGPNLHPGTAGQIASVTFKVYGANVITSGRATLLGYRSSPDDVLRLSVSRDAGLNWETVWTAAGTGLISADIPLTAAVLGGAFEYLCRIEMLSDGDAPDCGLVNLELETLTQVNRLSLPGLRRGTNLVQFSLGQQTESLMLWPPLHDDGGGALYLDTAASDANVLAMDSPHHFYSAVLRPATGGVPAQVTWRFDTPTDITSLYYGGSLLARESGPLDHVDLLHSLDGQTFTRDAVFDHTSSPTYDGRVYADVPVAVPGQRSVHLRYEFGSSHAPDLSSTGIQDALMYVNYTPRDPGQQPVEVTWCWTEHRRDGDVERRHTQVVQLDTESWAINVGGYRDPTMNWVRVNLAGYGPDGPGVPGYSDGLDVGPGAGYDRRRLTFRWQDNVALGRPYTVSRAAYGANGDTDGLELTNGSIIPPSDYATSWIVQEQSALWDGDQPVVVTLDLEQAQTVAAVRLTTHQPNAAFAHADSVSVEISADGTNWQPYAGCGHDQIWSPPGDYLGWEHDRSPSFADLPALGRLAFPFWVRAETPAQARYVRCTFLPQSGRGIGISEIQVLSAVTDTDWPDREVDMPFAVAVEPDPEPDTAPDDPPLPDAQGSLLGCAPNPFNAATRLAYSVPVAGTVDLAVYDLSGKLVRPLVAGRHHPAGAYTLTWDGRDLHGRNVASGTYVCRLRAGRLQDRIKVLVVK